MKYLVGVVTFIMFMVFVIGVCALDSEGTNLPYLMVGISMPWLAIWGYVQSAKGIEDDAE